MRYTYDTSFSEKNLDFYKILEESGLGHTNVSISSLDSLAPLFPECQFFFKIAASHLKNAEKPPRYSRTPAISDVG
jgi:hypothetical protein